MEDPSPKKCQSERGWGAFGRRRFHQKKKTKKHGLHCACPGVVLDFREGQPRPTLRLTIFWGGREDPSNHKPTKAGDCDFKFHGSISIERGGRWHRSGVNTTKKQNNTNTQKKQKPQININITTKAPHTKHKQTTGWEEGSGGSC